MAMTTSIGGAAALIIGAGIFQARTAAGQGEGTCPACVVPLERAAASPAAG